MGAVGAVVVGSDLHKPGAEGHKIGGDEQHAASRPHGGVHKSCKVCVWYVVGAGPGGRTRRAKCGASKVKNWRWA